MLRYIKNKELWAIVASFSSLLLLVYFFAGHVPQDNLFSQGLHRLFAPAQQSVDQVRQRIQDYHVILADKRALEQELEQVREQLDQYKLQSLTWEENRAEFLRLQTMLGLSAQYLDTIQFISARVIARNPNTWDQFVMINKGADHGVTLNMPVITPDGLVGLVVNVNAKTAQIYLITDREIAVGVIVQPSREARGIVEGIGAAHELRMENIPYYSEIQPGDVVVTSGLSEIYPKGIRVGTVKLLHQEGNGLVMTASVTPFVNFDRLEEVMLLTGYPPAMEFTAESLPEEGVSPETMLSEEQEPVMPADR